MILLPAEIYQMAQVITIISNTIFLLQNQFCVLFIHLFHLLPL